MENYFSVKIIGAAARGYTFPAKKGIDLAENYAENCHKFETTEEAQKFIKDNKLSRRGFTAYIRSKAEIEVEVENKKKTLGLNKGIFRIVNEKGDTAFYNTEKQQYYFSPLKDGCAGFHDKSSAREYVVKIQGYFPSMKISYKKLK